ncbi:MAG: tetratricopeptide repeat protein [Flavobacteriales bacterium]|nr:tetratricopeptide repeat protein [Flavobacteriales bacterium]MCX7767735.1 tetratricopeptide repeat protein [Flavobacteriales bacterium]MDW8409370.1 tetratricopeptide repeat protein [Flavobacteriales bacterium]
MIWDDEDFTTDSPEEQTILEFEQMLALNKTKYFDSAQFEEMFDYYLRRNKIRKAEKTLEIGLEQHPYSVELKIRLCQLYIRRNRYERTLALLDELDEICGEQAELLMLRGEVYSDMQRHREAAACLERACRLLKDEEKEYLYIDIANEYFNDQNSPKAIEWLLKAIHANPDLDLAYFELYHVYRATASMDKAIEQFNRLIDEDPYNPKPWYYLGLVWFDQEKTSSALEALEYALFLAPEYDEARMLKAEILMEEERYEEALEELHILESNDYRSFYVYYCIGECHEMMGAFHRAKEYYKKSIRHNENYVGPWLGLAVVYSREGDYHKALPFIKRAEKLDPSDPDVLLYVGLIHKALGEYQKAEEAYTELLEGDSGYEEAWLDLGDLLYRQDRLQECAETMLEAIRANPDSTRLWARLAGILCLLNKEDASHQLLRAALEKDPNLGKEFVEYFPQVAARPWVQELLQSAQNQKS